MRTALVAFACLALSTAVSADWTYVVDLDRGDTPNETKDMQDVHLTAEHARPGHVSYAFRPVDRPLPPPKVATTRWITRYNMWNNWTWYDRVQFRLFNENAEPVVAHFEVRTRHARKAGTDVTLAPGANDVTIRFADLRNLAEKPFSLYDVSQWVLFFDKELAKPLYLSEYRLIRENLQLPVPGETAIGARYKAEDAALASEKEDADPLALYWAAATFPAGKAGRFWIELPPDEKNYNTFNPPTNWLGYERVTFLCDNPGAVPARFDLLLEDFTARACRETKYRADQAVVVPLEAKPGRSTISADLANLKTVDGRRWFDPSQVYRIGIRVTNPATETKLRFADFRVRTTNEAAGILTPKEGAKLCGWCHERLDDANANCCPFCGHLMNPLAVVTPPEAGSVSLTPVKDGSASAASGGGDPSVDQAGGVDQKLGVNHYDMSYWEGRSFLRFDPSAIPAGKRVKKAELRLTSSMPGSQGKSWLCPMRIFAAPDGQDDFDEQTLSWMTQPPIGDFAAQGGLYYYWTDRMAMDVTDWLRSRLARTNKPFTFVLRAFVAAPCVPDAHLLGHHFSFWSRECKDGTKRPALYVEFE